MINVQGDQPFLDPAVVTAMVKAFSSDGAVPAVVTPVYRLKPASIHNPAVVKTFYPRCVPSASRGQPAA